jgi:transcriptional regulator with XRE-family HTH domain
MPAGLRLRQARERLGLTYRAVEQATFDLASRRGRPEFIIRISRLADIENHSVTPSLHKLYSLSAIYHLDPAEVMSWYEIPVADHFRDGAKGVGTLTHLAASPARFRIPLRFDPGFDPARTNHLTRMVESWGYLEAGLRNGLERHCYGYVGLADRTMDPLIRPGSMVLVDTGRRKVQNTVWKNEYERPIYFVDVRNGYRCSWCLLEGNRLILQPHFLSPCAPEARRFPEDAEVVGQVVGLAMRLDGA